nr:MAG TPA: hypothetical protein [Caudoviricetes sp.]
MCPNISWELSFILEVRLIFVRLYEPGYFPFSFI